MGEGPGIATSLTLMADSPRVTGAPPWTQARRGRASAGRALAHGGLAGHSLEETWAHSPAGGAIGVECSANVSEALKGCV